MSVVAMLAICALAVVAVMAGGGGHEAVMVPNDDDSQLVRSLQLPGRSSPMARRCQRPFNERESPMQDLASRHFHRLGR